MEEKRQAWGIAWWQVAAIALGIFIAVISLGYGVKLGGIGVATDPKYKTLWDWLDLLIVPLVLAGVATIGGAWFTRQRAQEVALQAYLDKMSELLIDKNLHKKNDRYDDTRVTARARTLAVLSQLDGKRKRTVLLFLRESRLINRDLHVRNFRTVYPCIVGLKDANLKNAELRGAKLIDAEGDEPVSLEGANLEGADLQDADLEGADLEGANLEKAKLNRANLSGSKLSRANLKGANVTNAQLALCEFLEGATMPNGQKYEGWLGTPEGQDWLRKYKKMLGAYKKGEGVYEDWIKTTEGEMWLKAVGKCSGLL